MDNIAKLQKEIEDLKDILTFCNGLAFADYNEALNKKEDELIEAILLKKFIEFNKGRARA